MDFGGAAAAGRSWASDQKPAEDKDSFLASLLALLLKAAVEASMGTARLLNLDQQEKIFV